MMNKLLAMCGINCTECDAYKATRQNDDKMRAETAEKWAKMFNPDIKPEHINCDGCTSNEKHFTYCGMCQIRLCGVGRKLANCASCDDYPCDKLTEFHNQAPAAKQALDEIRARK